LDKQIKNNGLTESDLDSETKAAIEEAKKDPTNSQKKDKAEEGIAVCGANKDLNNILAKVKKVTTEKEKKELITKIMGFISKNKYSIKAYQKRKSEVEKALAQLRGGKEQGENISPDKKPFPYLTLTICLVAVLGVVAVVFLIYKRRKRLVKRVKLD